MFATIYRVAEYSGEEKKYNFTLDMPGDDVLYYSQGDYEIPEGYTLDTDEHGPCVYDSDGDICTLHSNKYGILPMLTSSKGDIVLKKIRNGNNHFFLLRKMAGLTQTDLADASGINIRQIQRYESGESDIGNMTLNNATDLARALGCHAEDLLSPA